jgi:site-specific DNA-methyltransferase (adenine-specific)
MTTRLFNQDCMTAMKAMPDKAYELAIVDPPYGVGDFKQSVGYTRRPYNKDWPITWNDTPPGSEYFTELLRISKHQIIWGCNYYWQFIATPGVLVWDKGNQSNIGSSCELASLSMRTRVEKYFYQWKPVRLYEWLLKNYAKPGDKILDTHCGSGSILIACDIMGYSIDAYEIDSEYYEAAKERLERHQKQGVLSL